MADVTIEAAAHGSTRQVANRAGIFWTTPLIGYVIYLDSSIDLVYRKTVNGGANWAAAVNIRTGYLLSFDCWADWQTAGDAGTKIHIVYIDTDANEVRYVYLDTSGDSVGGDDLIEADQGTGMTTAVGRDKHLVSITKTRGGNLAVAFHYASSLHYYSFYTSPDGDTWTSRNSPWEAVTDLILLFPANLADNQDLWAAFWDIDADEISLKTFDDSGNSWSEQSISGSMENSQFAESVQMDGAIRLSDGHLIFAAWNDYDNPASDLMVWDINGAASITAKTNVITNEADTFLASVFVNQVNDDIYIVYLSGTDPFNLSTTFYQKSVDGGANWGGEQAMQADAADDERWISAGCMKAAWGGKFQPFWFNNDFDALFTNADNGISIAAEEPAAGLENKSANMGSKMVAAGLI